MLKYVAQIMKLRNQGVVFKMTLLGLSLALFIVLNYASFNLQFVKFSLKGLPVIFVSVVFGPLSGMLVGGLGELINQLVSPYGITATTPLWIVPWILQGLIVGLLFKQKHVKAHPVLWIVTVITCCIVVTSTNTLVIWVDGLIMGYNPNLTKLNIVIRFASSIASAVLYAVITPFLFEPLIKQGKFDIEKEA